MEKRVDKRVIKSKKAIRESFLSLLQEKELNKITIKDIAEKAQVDRKTFYNYYPSVFALLNEFENELIVSLDALFDEIDFSRFVEDPDKIFTSLSNFLKPNLDYYKTMFKMNFSENLSKKIVGLLKFKIIASYEKTLKSLNVDPNNYDLGLVAEYLASAILGVYFKWIEEGGVSPIEAITKDIGDLTLYGMNGYLIKKPNYDYVDKIGGDYGGRFKNNKN